ncbi:DEAD/DEAH box helicase [Amycolatopsis sp. La24]|uniref:DEAD/DEAH box helicase n=1 Tax=Amycolatopsis sp. La24 TaxID=3028304 RepID=UPI0023B09E9E|nr:DEAD/DEAH box helicase [Amycolatopsis sp. La24]
MNFADSSVLRVVTEQSERVLKTYSIDRGLIREHANAELRITQGGYGDRQIYELVQNGADELREHPGGEISVVLTGMYLYCANEGAPITPQGADTILRMSSSHKRGGQIGRFGVGVKSVLSVSDSPEFYSSTGCFGFDKDWSAARIHALHPDVVDIPVLRMAKPIDRERAEASDPILAELLSWATTVVRLPLHTSAVLGLGRDLDSFPAEFLLFSPHVGTVTLENRIRAKTEKRQIFQRVYGDRRTIQKESASGSSSTVDWRVFTRVHRPSERALLAAGELHDRPELDISWAVPARPGRDTRLGEFWAYFPTKYKTTLRGIVNAPWKTSEDRQNLYGGNAFNTELIEAVADLVVDSFPLLARPDDPAAYLDAAPARGREEPQWASDALVSAIWQGASRKPAVPDQKGELVKPSSVHLHPDALRPEWLEAWRTYGGSPVDWAHHSIEHARPRRRASAELIYSTAEIPAASVREWLEALVVDGAPEASGTAIRIAAEMLRTGHALADQALKAKIVLTESHGMVAPSLGNIFRRVSTDSLVDTNSYVDERVVAQFGMVSALDELGIHEADAAGRFVSIVEAGFHGYDDVRWSEFWASARLAGAGLVVAQLKESACDVENVVHVRTVSGAFRTVADCLLPGPVVPGDGSRDGGIAVDVDFHSPDLKVLRDLGMREVPRADVNPRSEPWFDEYREFCWRQYVAKLPLDAPRPQQKRLRVDGPAVAGPLHLLEEMSDEGRAAFVSAAPRSGTPATWAMRVPGSQAVNRDVISPFVWMARRYGRVWTGKGIRTVSASVGPRLRNHGDLFAVADVSEDLAEVLRLPSDIRNLPPRLWKTLLEEVNTSDDDELPGKVYALMFETAAEFPDGEWMTRCRVGEKRTSDLPDDQIVVTASRADYHILVAESVPALLVPDHDTAEALIDGWGMRNAAEVIEREIRYVAQGESMLLVDEFPPLRQLPKDKIEGRRLVRCSELEQITHTPNGERGEQLRVMLNEKDVLVLNPADDLSALRAVDDKLKLGLGIDGCGSILERRRRQQEGEQLKKIRAAATLQEKALQLIGPEALKRKLPEGLLESDKIDTGRVPDEMRIAQLALDAHGEGLLRHHARDIEARLPEAARSFRGDSSSRQLVNDLQLPESFAGIRAQQTREAVLFVEGPSQYPRLHDYQEKLAEKMFELLMRRDAGRGMLCLPTGAGKTRIAAEAVIRVIKAAGLRGRPVLWIAQTDELCEQAVQSWSFVWSKVGPGDRLTISRLWSGNSAAAVRETAHLVVATDAKLLQCLEKPAYEWLRDAALVVVDEAHASITPGYTQLFKALGITYAKTERPLVGLTATPFRGFNDAETKRLVDRYGGERLDQGVFEGDPYPELQELGVLAKVQHRELAGATMPLTDKELADAAPFSGYLPSTAEKRLGQDDERNRMLLTEIESLPKDWPVLVFATSVAHAKLMAARLTGKGVAARAIDSAMSMAERRRIVEEYRQRRIRVITNYGVLAQGFDAPATRVVVVARPTYSPNVYTQMIGRGLRGPKNGGEETCLILDVNDNITNYQKELAFTGLEHLWEKN